MIREPSSEWLRADHPLHAWRPVHAALARVDDEGRLVLRAGTETDFHLLRVVEPRAAYSEVRLEVTLAPAPTGAAAFTVNGWGNIDLAVISRDGRLLKEHRPGSVQVTPVRPDGFFTMVVTYRGSHPAISIGTHATSAFHPGSGCDEFLIREAAVWTREAESRLGAKG